MTETARSQAAESRYETTLWELVNAIREVSDNDEEVVAVLQTMFEEGRISVHFELPSCAA